MAGRQVAPRLNQERSAARRVFSGFPDLGIAHLITFFKLNYGSWD